MNILFYNKNRLRLFKKNYYIFKLTFSYIETLKLNRLCIIDHRRQPRMYICSRSSILYWWWSFSTFCTSTHIWCFYLDISKEIFKNVQITTKFCIHLFFFRGICSYCSCVFFFFILNYKLSLSK